MLPEDSLAAQRQLVDALRDPARYPHPVSAVTVIETHISFVLLTGEYAYKIKKAVDLGFVSYLGRERRRFFCAEELRLNRRLAPQIYLGTVAFGGSPQAPTWDDGGEPFEFAVKMREFCQDELLDREIARGTLVPAQIDLLAATIAAFHGAAPPAAAEDGHGTPEAIWEPVAANFSHLGEGSASDLQTPLARLEAWCRSEHARLAPAFRQRKAAGFVRECHGDLHLGNMALLGRQPLIFDCIEFSPELRWIDVASDLSFLLMDLSERGRPDLAWRLLNDWLERTGDHAALDLLRFYQVYRALVRAKVAKLRAGEPGLADDGRRAAIESCRTYVRHAAGLIAPAAPFLLITHGYSGAGKTTVARAVAQELGAVCLRSDIERKRLHGLAPLARSASPVDGGIYGEAAGEATYERLAKLAERALAAGYPVVVDAACLRAGQRRRFRELAASAGLPFFILACEAPPATLQRRIAKRMVADNDASDATLAVLARQIQAADPLSDEERRAALVFAGGEDQLPAYCARLRRHLPASPAG